MDFRLKDGEKVRTMFVDKASATVIEAGDFIEMADGLAIKATATGAKLAWCPKGGADGDTQIEVSVGKDFTLLGTADTNYVVATHGNGLDCDLVVNSTVQEIDLGATSTKVLTVKPGGGTAGSDENIEVRINLPLF